MVTTIRPSTRNGKVVNIIVVVCFSLIPCVMSRAWLVVIAAVFVAVILVIAVVAAVFVAVILVIAVVTAIRVAVMLFIAAVTAIIVAVVLVIAVVTTIRVAVVLVIAVITPDFNVLVLAITAHILRSEIIVCGQSQGCLTGSCSSYWLAF